MLWCTIAIKDLENGVQLENSYFSLFFVKHIFFILNKYFSISLFLYFLFLISFLFERKEKNE
jgi:hypothetical protein